MTEPLTDEQLAEIEAGLEGVTEGPWTVDQSGYRRSTPTVMSGGYFICTTGPYDVRGDPRGQTATHIARLNPETVAAWLARDKAQRAEIEQLMRRNNMAMECIDEMLKDALADKIGDMKLTVSPDLHWRDKEEK